ncbi:discoidin domain-containing protein [Nocardioides mesophilus]|uniref:discoidin domain-containing protein n=1 Tax=Nocardioides mesophilus TaxID=433659 RepID=UPI003CCD96AC
MRCAGPPHVRLRILADRVQPEPRPGWVAGRPAGPAARACRDLPACLSGGLPRRPRAHRWRGGRGRRQRADRGHGPRRLSHARRARRGAGRRRGRSRPARPRARPGLPRGRRLRPRPGPPACRTCRPSRPGAAGVAGAGDPRGSGRGAAARCVRRRTAVLQLGRRRRRGGPARRRRHRRRRRGRHRGRRGDRQATEAGQAPEGADAEAGGGRLPGITQAAVVAGTSASCEADSSVDAAGNQIAYPPQNAVDQDTTTAWRCDGSGVGQTLTLTLGQGTRIGEVGLIPGYAKTDPRSGVDRYAENNRITRVRWRFDDGSSVEQRLDGTAANRSLQTLRIPVTTSGSVVLEVLDSTPGSRDTMAVSEVRIGTAG